MSEIDGRRIESETLATIARAWRSREADITSTAATPYRCIGPVIYALQRAGFTRIGFISEPAIEE